MGINILLVENDFIIQMFIAQVLKDLGCSVKECVEEGDKAISFLQNNENVDLILMDVGIDGDKDGIETAQVIRKTHQTPIVFMTGNSDELTLTRAKEMNPLDILSKPIDEPELRNKVTKIMRQLKGGNF